MKWRTRLGPARLELLLTRARVGSPVPRVEFIAVTLGLSKHCYFIYYRRSRHQLRFAHVTIADWGDW